VVEIVHLLLEHGADVKAVNDNGKTALQVVGKTTYVDLKVPVDQGQCGEITRLLVEHGAK